jgi:pyruvate/2-oxoglutarate dehydrogenase complex dihydrolipoamide acyltransferase (E2) component
MATEILMPKLGFDMNEGILTEWLAPNGADIAEGQPLYAIESDKSNNEIEAPASGRLRIVAATEETYEVGTVLGYID